MQIPDLIIEGLPFILETETAIANLAKRYETSLVGLHAFWNGNINITLPQSLVDGLPETGVVPDQFAEFQTGDSIFTYQSVVYLLNPFNFSASSENITSPILSFRLLANGMLQNEISQLTL